MHAGERDFLEAGGRDALDLAHDVGAIGRLRPAPRVVGMMQ